MLYSGKLYTRSSYINIVSYGIRSMLGVLALLGLYVDVFLLTQTRNQCLYKYMYYIIVMCMNTVISKQR